MLILYCHWHYSQEFFLDLCCHVRYNSFMSKTKQTKKGSRRARAEILQVRLSPSEKTSFERAAQIAGVPLSSWVRERLRVAALRDLDSVGEPAPFMQIQEGDDE